MPPPKKLTGLAGEDVLGKMSIQMFTMFLNWPGISRKKIYSGEYGGPGRVDGIEVCVKGDGGRKIPIRLSAALIY